jgi:cephalosporin-C deacetylase-like acetyl esterase
MRRIERLRFVLCCAAVFCLLATRQAVAQQFEVRIVTDRPEAIYQAGEAVEFRVTLLKDKVALPAADVTYVLSNDGYGQLSTGKATTAAEPVAITGKLDKPGFLRCQATYTPPEGKAISALAAAAIDPLLIGPSLPAPDDFDAYWAEQKKLLAAVPLNPRLTPVEPPAKEVECFDLQVDCAGGKPVSGYFARPTGAAPRSLPAILFVHGAGVRSSILSTADNNAAAGRLALDINAHGIPNGKPDEFYKQLTEGELRDYRFAGRDSRDTSYFRGMYLRLIRAIDFLTAQPEWDGKIVIVTGHSQGGGQSLVAAGLDPRVTALASGVPAMCDHSGNAAGRINGWPRLVPVDGDGKPAPLALEASRYFDAVNFAGRTRADALLSVGFIDTVCPPTSVYAAYNQLPGKKRMLNEPLMGHAAPGEIQAAFGKMIDEHIARMQAAGEK